MGMLFEFFEGFSTQKLQQIVKIFNLKIKNVTLENFVDDDVHEVSRNVNPFYELLTDLLHGYRDKQLSARYAELVERIS